ncbi:MAG TPA: DUF4932 domain-containing protein [bacterium]|nr:DUF4932 domain-containing protein [bacterium]HPN45697.1 DUF4932 domain-containing protein [bacterium]
MKKTGFLLLICLIILIGCNKAGQFELPADWERQWQTTLDSRIQAEIDRLNIVIDPRIELLSVVQLLAEEKSGQEFGTKLDYSYSRDVLAYFQPFIDHPAVQKLAALRQLGFSHDALPKLVLHASAPPELQLICPLELYLIRETGGNKNVETFFQFLRDFAVQSDFTGFFNAHKELYTTIVRNEAGIISDNDYVKVLETFYGEIRNSYNIILVPLYDGHGFGIYVNLANGLQDIYAVCGFSRLQGGLPSLGVAKAYSYLVFHELSHPFIDLSIGGFQQRIDRYASLYTPISANMRKQAYGTWSSCVEEHLVRVVTERLVYRDYPEEMSAALESDKRLGFAYVGALSDRIALYEQNRKKYPRFKDFYPEIVKVFKELDASDLNANFYATPFSGSVNTLFSDGGPIVFIMPTNEPDRNLATEMNNVLNTLRNNDAYFHNMEIMPDSLALQRDLANHWIFAIGPPQENKWLAQFIQRIPVKIETDKIIADSVYYGNNLVFMTTWPHPQNEQKGVQILTGQNLQSIWMLMNKREEINSQIKDAGINWFIADGLLILNTGTYNKINGVWSF